MIFIVSSILFTLCFALYFKWQNKDEYDGTFAYNKNDKKWHFYGACMRALYYIPALYYCFFPSPTLKEVILALAINLPLYDIAINIFALNQPIFYPGSSSDYDKKLGMTKWVLYLLFLVASIVYCFI